ncbi:MAG: VWA domain-containing protein [Gemmatimonadota bacterium]|jgi:Ca-activated chloride channel family protein
MFRFGAFEWLGVLVVVPVLLALYGFGARSRRRALERFAEAPLVAKLTASVSVQARRVKVALTVTAAALAALALARPQFGTRVETVRSVGQDIMVAVDLSQSMLAGDVAPNRLERARFAILRLMRQLDGDRIGLVAFAGDAFVQSPLTVDYTAAALFLNAMEPSMMPVQGTDLGAALRVSLDALEEARESRVLVVITDGEDHEEGFQAQVDRAVQDGVRIHTVGIGSAEGVPIPQVDESGRPAGFLRDEDGAVVTTRLDEETLRSIAGATGGTFVRAGVGGTAFDQLVDELSRAEGEALDARQITQFEEQYQIFLGAALLLLLVERLIPGRMRAREAWSGRFEA